MENTIAGREGSESMTTKHSPKQIAGGGREPNPYKDMPTCERCNYAAAIYKMVPSGRGLCPWCVREIEAQISRNCMTTPFPKSKGRKPQFTPKQVERMMHMRYTENLRCHEIAAIMGTTKSTVERYTRRPLI
jgi:hypothetical protein